MWFTLSFVSLMPYDFYCVCAKPSKTNKDTVNFGQIQSNYCSSYQSLIQTNIAVIHLLHVYDSQKQIKFEFWSYWTNMKLPLLFHWIEWFGTSAGRVALPVTFPLYMVQSSYLLIIFLEPSTFRCHRCWPACYLDIETPDDPGRGNVFQKFNLVYL